MPRNVVRNTDRAGRRVLGALVAAALGSAVLAVPVSAATPSLEGDAGGPAAIAAAIGTATGSGRNLIGRGVDIAVIDTGIADVPGLRGRVVRGPDFSGGSSSSRDGHGHGTHMAGLIAGHDDDSGFRGVAPGARILDIKVGNAGGGTSAAQVAAAVDWVVRNRDRNGMDVRVLTIASGAHVTGNGPDPVTRAVERATAHGIVVVAAAGNGGAAGLTVPASAPGVVAVGAGDSMGTGTTGDDAVAAFSAVGSAARPVDVVAPGRSVLSLRAPGSLADTDFPSARVGESLFKGTGTSQAAAVASGAVALLLEARPELTPAQVKALLRSTARPIAGDAAAAGSGMVDLGAALAAPVPHVSPSPASPAAGKTASTWGSAGWGWTGWGWTGWGWTGWGWTGWGWTGWGWTGWGWTGWGWTGWGWT